MLREVAKILNETAPREQCAPKEPPNPRKPIRVGLVLDSPLAPRWIGQLVEQLLSTEGIDLAVLVISAKPRPRHVTTKPILFRLWSKLDNWAFGREDDALTPELRTYPVPMIRLAPSDADEHTLSAELVRLRGCHLDVLVALGSGILPGEFGSCAAYGLWTFQYSGHPDSADEIALFSNLHAGNSSYELVLRVETGEECGNCVLYRGRFSSHSLSLRRNLALDTQRRARILLQHLVDLHRSGWTKTAVEESAADYDAGPTRCLSLNSVMPRFVGRWVWRCLRRLFSMIRFREQWVIAYSNVKSPRAEQVGFGPFHLIIPPRDQHYADPFLFEHHGKRYIFFEQYADGQPGTICCTEFDTVGTPGPIRHVLRRNYHLSYPFVFEWQGDIYLMPETWDNRTVEVYGAVAFPDRWELAGVLLSDITAVDPTLLVHEGMLWLFAGGIGGPGTELSELFLFFSDSLFSDWQPHPKNPVVSDVRRARPAGSLFFEDDFLIRPGQDCSHHYGYAISLNRVDVLSETEYRETPLRTILPNWAPGLVATHTLNCGGGTRVLDGKARIPRWGIHRKFRGFPRRVTAALDSQFGRQ